MESAYFPASKWQLHEYKVNVMTCHRSSLTGEWGNGRMDEQLVVFGSHTTTVNVYENTWNLIVLIAHVSLADWFLIVSPFWSGCSFSVSLAFPLIVNLRTRLRSASDVFAWLHSRGPATVRLGDHVPVWFGSF